MYQGRKILRSDENGLGTLRSIGVDGMTRVIGQNNTFKSSQIFIFILKKYLLAKKAPK